MARESLFQFRWQVSLNGYRVIKTETIKSGEQRVLTDMVPIGDEYQAKRYSPLDQHTGLFRSFAELALDEESICDFANRFGLLGEDQSWVRLQKNLTRADKDVAGWGEPLETWAMQIQTMKRAVELWDWSSARDVPSLNNVITWSGTDRFNYAHETARIRVQEAFRVETNPEVFAQFRPGDVIQPARYILQKIVNSELKKRVSPTLLWENNWLKLGLYFAPSNLLGAIWLQFANAVDKNPKFKRCQTCRTWFELSSYREDRQHCSDACRTRAYRKRKEMESVGMKRPRRPTPKQKKRKVSPRKRKSS